MERLLIQKMGKSWFLIISLIIVSCVNDRSGDLIISRNDFRDILIKFQKIQLNESFDPSALDSTLEKVLLDNNITVNGYQNTISFYSERPSEMLDILYEVKDSVY